MVVQYDGDSHDMEASRYYGKCDAEWGAYIVPSMVQG